MDAIERALLDLSGEVFSTGPAYLREGASRRILSTLVREARVEALREARARSLYWCNELDYGPHYGAEKVQDDLDALIAAAEESSK